MRQDLYLQFLSLNFKRRKSEAKARLIDFIDSFQSDGEIREWVRNFLESGEHGYQIQYELYERLIFPELLSGYKRNDAWSVLWLANTVVNLYANPDLHLQIGNIGERELLSKAFACIPTEELRERLLFNYLHSFSYCEHDWPAAVRFPHVWRASGGTS